MARTAATRALRPAIGLTLALTRAVASYVYRGSDVPKPADEPARLNLWLFGGDGSTTVQGVEIVVESFAFTP